MKTGIHPQSRVDTEAKCNSGGAVYLVLSIMEKIEVEVCSKCHPFYTGDQRIMDTAGRVERFLARKNKATVKKS